MKVIVLEIISFIVVLMSIVIPLMIKLQDKFWFRFGTVMLPLILVSTLIYNLISFPSTDRAGIWSLQRLPSNELIDLFDESTTPIKTAWLYPLIDSYYQSRTLIISDSLLGSLNLSVELLQTQGHLADIKIIDLDTRLSEGDVELILGMEIVDLRMVNGHVYHFVTEELDPGSPLLLLRHEKQLFFIPEDLLPDPEGSL